MEQRTLAPGVRYATLREGLKELIETPPSLRCDAETIIFFAARSGPRSTTP